MARRFTALLALLLALAVAFAATLPEARRSMIDTRGPLHPYLHVATFLLIAWLAAWSTRSVGVRLLLCIGIALFGCATELLEWRMSANPLEWTDIVLDAMGTVAGTGLAALTMPRHGFGRDRYTDER